MPATTPTTSSDLRYGDMVEVEWHHGKMVPGRIITDPQGTDWYEVEFFREQYNSDLFGMTKRAICHKSGLVRKLTPEEVTAWEL